MTKKFGIRTVNGYQFRTFKKTFKPIVEINNRIYRCDDELFLKENQSELAILIYPMDSTQPLGTGEYVNPDQTKIYIDSMKNSGKKATFLSDLSINKLIPFIVIGAIVMSAAYALTGGA